MNQVAVEATIAEKTRRSRRGDGSISRGRRRAITSFEVLVAFTLLSSVLSLSASLLIRHSRLLTAQRDYRLALDELSNQLDRLTGLPADDAPQAVKQLTLSPFTAERLPNAKLVGELTPVDIGQRVTLRLTRDDPQGFSAAMAGWVYDSRPTRGRRPVGGR